MQHEVLLEKIAQNLSFEVKPIPHSSNVKISGPSGRTPVKVKVKVRKKDKADVYRGLISVPEKHPSGTLTDKLRVVSSDQTITSFEMFLEAEQKLPMKKHRNKFFDLLRPGICLGNHNDEKDYYLPRNSQNTIGSITSKSDGVLKPHLPISKKDYIEASTALSKKNPYFLGKCKPGGCLDPPFSEDKYSYIPSKKHSPVELFTIASKTLYVADDIGTPKKLSDPKTTSAKHKVSLTDSTTNVEALSQEYLPGKSIQKLYQAESVNTSLSITYSNSIITYPPPLTPSEIRFNNEKNAHQRGSTDSRTKRSYDLPQTYFMPPREIINLFDSKDPSRSKVNPKGENGSAQENYSLKSPSNINNVLAEDMEGDLLSITTATRYQFPQHIESSNVDIKIAPVVDHIAIKTALEDNDCLSKEEKSFTPCDSTKDIILEPTLPLSQQQQELKSLVETPKSGSFIRKSVEKDFKPSVKSLLAETNLILHKISSGLLIPKDNEIHGKTVNILPLSLEESNSEKRGTMQTSFPKINTMNLQKSCDIKGSKSSSSSLQQNVDNSKSNKEIDDLQKEPMERQSKLDSRLSDPTEPMLRSRLDTEIFNILKETKDSQTDTQKDLPTFVNDIQSEPRNTAELVSETIYNANEDVAVKKTSPLTRQTVKLTSTEEEQPHIEHSSKKSTIGDDSEVVLKQKEKDYPISHLQEENNINSLLDGRHSENIIALTPDIFEDEPSKPSVDKLENQNGEDSSSISKIKLDIEPFLHHNIDKSNGSVIVQNEHLDITASPTSIISLPKQSDGILRDQLTKVEKLDQIATDTYDTDDLKQRVSQIIPDFEEPFKDITKTAVQIIEDANPLDQESDLPQQDIEITLQPLSDHSTFEHPVILESSSVVSIQRKEGFKADDRLLSGIYKKDKLENIEADIKTTESVDKLKDSNIEEVAKIYPQHLLDNKENQFIDQSKTEVHSKLDSFLEVPQYQSSTQLLRDGSKPLQVVYNIEQPSNVFSDTIVDTKILQDIERKQEEEDELDVPDLDNIVQLRAPIDTTKEISRDSDSKSSKPNKKNLMESELGNTDETIATSEILKKPLDLSNSLGIQDAEHGPSLTQIISSDEDKYNLGSRYQQSSKTEFTIPEALKKEYETIPNQSLNLKEEENAVFLGDISTEYDESYAKSFRTSTMFDVLAIPDPKKLKGEIAILKSNTVLYTPSKTTLPEIIKKDSVAVDLAFHSHVNENNESVLRTFNSDKEPQRFADDRIIIIKSDINLNNEINIPIDNDRNLIVQLKRANETTHDQQYVFKDAGLSIEDRPEEKNIRFKLDAETDNSMPINIQSVYEKELLPLQSAIKQLKNEIDDLQRHNLLLKDNLLTHKSKPIRLTNVKRCVCLKRIHLS